MKKITSWFKNVFSGKKAEAVKLVQESVPTGGFFTEGLGKLIATLKELETRGVTPEHLRRIRSDENFAAHVAGQIVLMPQGAPIPVATAWDIMGIDNTFVTMAEWMTLFNKIGYNSNCLFSEKEKTLPILDKIPISEKDLWEVRHSHFLFLGISHIPDGTPLTIKTWQKILPKMEEARLETSFISVRNNAPVAEKYFAKQPFFAEQTLQLKWYLVRKDALPLSRSLYYKSQCSLLPDQEEVATPLELVTALTLSSYKHNAGPQFQLRTAQKIDDRGSQLIAGLTEKNVVLSADYNHLDHEYQEINPDIGLATSWKFPEI